MHIFLNLSLNFKCDKVEIKDIVEKIEQNNAVIGDVEDSVETVIKIVSDVKSHNYTELINDGMDLGNELSKIPGDLKWKFIAKNASAVYNAVDWRNFVTIS